MASLNKVQLIGNLGQDPELKYTTSGKAVANLSLATSFGTGDSEKTEWHRLVAWDKQAELLGKYAKKGSKIYVEGRIETRKWEDKEGATKYSTEIIVTQIVLLDRKADVAEPEPAPVSKPRRAAKKTPQSEDGEWADPHSEDMPF